jgi:hypothetical protein
MERTAECHCRSLKVIVAGEPERVYLCHCKECQRRTGAIVHSGATYLKGQVRIEGEHKVYAPPRWKADGAGSCEPLEAFHRLDDVEQIKQDDDRDRNTEKPEQNWTHRTAPFQVNVGRLGREIRGLMRGRAGEPAFFRHVHQTA